MKTAVEIYKLLPKTNCGSCGTGSCFGFAAKLASHQARHEDCPTMIKAAREALAAAGEARDRGAPGTVYEQVLDLLRPRIAAMNFEAIAENFGVRAFDASTLSIPFLNATYRVTKEKIVDQSGAEARPWIAILIYNHLSMPAPPAPSGEWVTFGSIPASHAKDKAWAGHVEEVIAGHFSGKIGALKKACEELGGVPASIPGNHDAAFAFRFFPHYPVLLLFHEALPEENFPAQCRLLLDKTAPYYLDIESIVVLGEEFAGRMTA